ncbi:MAG TPA: hypothetical protein VMF89_14890, partial [Polyangiales bacterium]|nr:hypothetical protein [Polyangiales bacterium]
MPESSRWLPWQVLSLVLAAAGCESTLTSGLVFEALPEALAPASEGPCAFVHTPSVDTRNELCPTGTYSGDVRLANGRFEALQGCVRVAGSVQVELSNSDQLRALDALEVVDGSLVITASSTIAASAGLPQLRCISGDLSLSRDAPIAGFSQLREVGGSLTIAAGALPGDAELPQLQRVWGNVDAPVNQRMPALETIYGRLGPQPWAAAERREAMRRLSYVGCSAEFKPCRDGILGCDFEAQSQHDVEQLTECRHARADLQLQAADIRDLTVLSRLQSVTGQLSIGPLSGDGVLPSLDGLDQLRSVGALSVQNLPELEDLQGLGMLGRAGHIDIRACNGLQDLYGLDTLGEVRGRLRLANNAGLRSLAGAPALRELDELVLDGNASLTSLRGAASQITRLTALTVEHNTRLETLDGADMLTRARNLFVSDNA